MAPKELELEENAFHLRSLILAKYQFRNLMICKLAKFRDHILLSSPLSKLMVRLSKGYLQVPNRASKQLR